MKLATADLFSGLGGNAYAFRSFSHVVTYCENDPQATALLKRAMERGFIDAAPVAPDVCKLTAADLVGVDFMTASWPCQGNSSCGKKRGMNDGRSGLICNVVDLLKSAGDASPAILFFENVPTVLKNGSFAFLHRELLPLGYAVAWCLLSAEQLGHTHGRKRFFCVASKNNALLADALAASTASKHVPTAGERVEPRRMQVLHGEDKSVNKQLCGAFGNAVVPGCSKFAFESLASALLTETPEEKPLGDTFPRWGVSKRGGVAALKPPTGLLRRVDELTLLRADAYEKDAWDERFGGAGLPPYKKKKNKGVREKRRLKLWATPRKSNTGACHVGTHRAMGDLASQLRFAVDTPDADRGGEMRAGFVQWLMGFPDGYLCD
jgi:site-specific DNA-cytosine methylase